jgi:hypothetical protein
MGVAMGGIAVIAWLALVLQLYLTIATTPAGGGAVLERVVNYFSFFTILTNLLVALVLTFSLRVPDFWGRLFSSAATQTGTAVYIAIVGATYSVLLRHLWIPEGAQKLADVLLHDVVPVAYVLYWLSFVPKAGLRWKHALLWLVYPIAYMLYTLLRGVSTGWYPYPFIDAGQLGFPRALGNGALVLLAFFVLGLVAGAIGRWTVSMRRGHVPAQYQ